MHIRLTEGGGGGRVRAESACKGGRGGDGGRSGPSCRPDLKKGGGFRRIKNRGKTKEGSSEQTRKRERK